MFADVFLGTDATIVGSTRPAWQETCQRAGRDLGDFCREFHFLQISVCGGNEMFWIFVLQDAGFVIAERTSAGETLGIQEQLNAIEDNVVKWVQWHYTFWICVYRNGMFRGAGHWQCHGRFRVGWENNNDHIWHLWHWWHRRPMPLWFPIFLRVVRFYQRCLPLLLLLPPCELSIAVGTAGPQLPALYRSGPQWALLSDKIPEYMSDRMPEYVR